MPPFQYNRGPRGKNGQMSQAQKNQMLRQRTPFISGGETSTGETSDNFTDNETEARKLIEKLHGKLDDVNNKFFANVQAQSKRNSRNKRKEERRSAGQYNNLTNPEDCVEFERSGKPGQNGPKNSEDEQIGSLFKSKGTFLNRFFSALSKQSWVAARFLQILVLVGVLLMLAAFVFRAGKGAGDVIVRSLKEHSEKEGELSNSDLISIASSLTFNAVQMPAEMLFGLRKHVEKNVRKAKAASRRTEASSGKVVSGERMMNISEDNDAISNSLGNNSLFSDDDIFALSARRVGSWLPSGLRSKLEVHSGMRLTLKSDSSDSYTAPCYQDTCCGNSCSPCCVWMAVTTPIGVVIVAGILIFWLGGYACCCKSDDAVAYKDSKGNWHKGDPNDKSGFAGAKADEGCSFNPTCGIENPILRWIVMVIIFNILMCIICKCCCSKEAQEAVYWKKHYQKNPDGRTEEITEDEYRDRKANPQMQQQTM